MDLVIFFQESSEPAVPEMVEKDDNDEEKDKADEQTGEKSESEEQKKMMLELKRILTPSSKKTEDIPQSSETKVRLYIGRSLRGVVVNVQNHSKRVRIPVSLLRLLQDKCFWERHELLFSLSCGFR